MHSTTPLLSLLALAACALAAPMPLHAIPRATPKLHEVIRNPAPIDAGLSLNLDVLKEHLGIDIHARAVPKLEVEAVSVVPVIGRAVPALKKVAEPVVPVVGR
jgi:hypothetical protein